MIIQLKLLENKFIKTVDEAIIEGTVSGKSCMSNDGHFFAFMKQDSKSNQQIFIVYNQTS